MKKLPKILGLAALTFFISSAAVFPKNTYSVSPLQDTTKLRELYSLFSEYYKNKDYKSAIPYGWQVIETDPKMFSKWIYDKMEDGLWQLHDSSDLAPEEIKAIEDTMTYFYDLAIENNPVNKGFYQAKKAFVLETWLKAPADTVIKAYETAIEYNNNISTYYYDRLGVLYSNNEMKDKSIDLYSKLSDKEPDNPLWPQRLESLVENIDELADINCKQWNMDKENLEKAWKCASTMIKASRYQDAIVALEFLVSKSPETINYWNQLASAYQKTEQLDKAESAYKKLAQIEQNNPNHFINLGILYKDKGQLAASRTQFQKANDVANGSAQAVYLEGLLYEQAARNCGFEFEDKVVYQLAVDTYRKALSIDSGYSQARDRISALSGSVPTKEDYFFRGHKSGQVIPIPNNDCYSWIGKSITVP